MSSQADALGKIQRLSAVFSAAAAAGGTDGDGGAPASASAPALLLCEAADALKPAERAELGSVRDHKGRTLLHHAAGGGNADAVRRVLDADYDPESKGEGGQGGAGAADAADAADSDKEAPSPRPPLDARDGSGNTALGLAASVGSVAAVDLLLRRGACPQGGAGAAAATTAADKTTTKSGDKTNDDNKSAAAAASDDAPLTPLHCAAAAPGERGAACVRRLLEAGARVDAPSDAAGTPLGMAALARNAAAARALLAAGANPDAATRSGVTPLAMAAANVDEELVAVLLGAGADPKRAAHGGMTPLHALAAAGLRRKAQRRRRRQQQQQEEEEEREGGGGGRGAADKDDDGDDEDKALGCAAARLARCLLDKGAEADAADGGGALPVVVAAACGQNYRPLVEALLPATKARPAGFANAAAAATPAAATGASGGGGDDSDWTADNLARYAEAQLRLQESEHEAARAAAEARVASSLQAGGGGAGGGGGGGAGAGNGGGNNNDDDDFDAATRPFPSPPAEVSPPSEAQAAELKAGGDAAFVRGNMRAAEKGYSDALRHWTQSAPLWGNRAAARLALGDAGGALSDARIARTLARDYVKAWYREGKAASALGRWRAAAGALAEAARLDPASDEVGEALEVAVAKARRAAQQQQQQK